MEIPLSLIDSIRNGRAILFLGSGASIGATNNKYGDSFLAKDLAKKICEKFLGDEYKDFSLQKISELAISERNLFDLQKHIADLFFDFQPADFHLLIPTFNWSAIGTTNYDLIIERAYDNVEDKLQKLVVFKKNGEQVEDRLREPNSVMYLKLHGCISDIYDENVPLIITPDQYVTHKKGRDRIFSKLNEKAYEYPIIFAGHSLDDMDIRAILNELPVMSEARPRSYLVIPNLKPAEIRFWQSRKIEPILMKFSEFMFELNNLISVNDRKLSLVKTDTTHFAFDKMINISKVSESLLTFLQRDVQFVHSGIKTDKGDPKSFYKGYFVDWAPIVEKYDITRNITDDVLTDVFLDDDQNDSITCNFVVLRGHAGCGKTVILKRLAWDAATEFNKLCIFLKDTSYLDFEPISELYRNYDERIYLFIDTISECVDTIEKLIHKARLEKIPLTIIGSERTNEWNINCSSLDGFVDEFYNVGYLNESEIDNLIKKLSKYNSLGYLSDKSIEEQRKAFRKRSGRQLLVALYEATHGKPFSEIIFDEYKSISSTKAQSLYLTVCIFHMLRVSVRAGLISRVHGIPFSIFEQELFKPLEFIVFAKMNNLIGDYEYRTRHSEIAKIVFEMVLTDPQDRYDEYIRIINSIDVDYQADREAFKGLTNAKELTKLFSECEMIREIYLAAKMRDPLNPMLMQQEAIFEMNSPEKNIQKAAGLLQRANKIAPYNKAISHSLSELAIKRAEDTNNPLERKKYLQEAKDLATQIIGKGFTTTHPFHTLIKTELFELEQLIIDDDIPSLERKIKDVEKHITKVIQLFPDDSYIRDIESKFNYLIHNHDRALFALEKAFSGNKRSAYIALRLAKFYESLGKEDESIQVLNACLDANPHDMDVNYQLALLLMKTEESKSDEIIHYLSHAFTKGDTKYMAQFWFARYKYLYQDKDEARAIFEYLNSIDIDVNIKRNPRGTVMLGKTPERFSGYISTIQSKFAFIIRDRDQDSIFAHVANSQDVVWDKLGYRDRVTFQIAFNFKGPCGLQILPE